MASIVSPSPLTSLSPRVAPSAVSPMAWLPLAALVTLAAASSSSSSSSSSLASISPEWVTLMTRHGADAQGSSSSNNNRSKNYSGSSSNYSSSNYSSNNYNYNSGNYSGNSYNSGNYSGSGMRRLRRAISESDKAVILDLHNRLRGQVSPTASNMEYLVWDSELERSAEHWAETCLWEHGPAGELSRIGQNLGAHWGRFRPPTFHVQAWYDEVRDYSFPYPHECNPWCPFRCTGPVCTHYTQLVWATSSRIGCAINLCYNMNVWGQVWARAVYLVCNYAPKGNWWGSAPYKVGRPCSECPPSYGGGCRDNMCFWGGSGERPLPGPDTGTKVEEVDEETEEEEGPNEVEPRGAPEPTRPARTTTTAAPPVAPPDAREFDIREVISVEEMTQKVTCDTKLRDRCKGTPCNRYECPAGCFHSSGKVIGTLYYDMQSSVCRAAMHYGIVDNEGGWVDVTRNGRIPFFVKSTREGITSISKYRPANSFTVFRVTVKALDCVTTVGQLCPYRKPATHCPRVHCPAHCMQYNPHQARVIGSTIYSDLSSACRVAVHAGVVQNARGGYVDLMPVDKKSEYLASFQNGIFSESLQNPPGGKAFRVFAVI
uniref:Cysteine-rich secretory protein LCCL domain-containing 1-like n=2 Tax=Petromyzon marinus TaxID=7757 RepID=A0AAJ7U9B4_PETMA|nr:cysteine-rich secretory protein LCCL domain-containing 1-like [Petromyzon marinus]